MKDKEKGLRGFLTRSSIMGIFFIIFLKPHMIAQIAPRISDIMNLLLVAISIIIIAAYILDGKISKIQLLIFTLFSIMLISTIINSGNIIFCCTAYIPAVAISMYTEMLIKCNLKKFLINLSCILGIFIIINFLTVIIFPGGHSGRNIYFLGLDNSSGLMVILSVVFITLTAYLYKGKQTLTSILIVVIACVTYLMTKAATPIIGCVIFVFFLFFIYKKKNAMKVFNYRVYLMVTIIFFVLFIILRMQNLFSYILVDLLGKDLTFNGRTLIWDYAIELFKKNPLLGTGMEVYETRLQVKGMYHAHNTYLNILMEGGVLGFVIYITILLVEGKQLVKNNVINSIISVGFFIYFIMGISEVYYNDKMLYVILVVGYYSNRILETFINEKEDRLELTNNKSQA